MSPSAASTDRQQSLFGSPQGPQRITGDHRSRRAYVKDLPPHETGTMFGIKYALWYCSDTGWAQRKNFILFRASVGGEVIEARRHTRTGFAETPLHHIDGRNHTDPRAELDRRLFRLYVRHVRTAPETPVAKVQARIEEARAARAKAKRIAKERTRTRKDRIRRAARLFGRPPELICERHLRFLPREARHD